MSRGGRRWPPDAAVGAPGEGPGGLRLRVSAGVRSAHVRGTLRSLQLRADFPDDQRPRGNGQRLHGGGRIRTSQHRGRPQQHPRDHSGRRDRSPGRSRRRGRHGRQTPRSAGRPRTLQEDGDPGPETDRRKVQRRGPWRREATGCCRPWHPENGSSRRGQQACMPANKLLAGMGGKLPRKPPRV